MNEMNVMLKELLEIQAGLDAEINAKHPADEKEDRLEKKHVALLVELGETLNENRKFKFWSTDRKPRVKDVCRKCNGSGGIVETVEIEKGFYANQVVECDECKGTCYADYQLKELVDCLHFVLSIGLEHKFDEWLPLDIEPMICYKDNVNQVEYQFIDVIKADWNAYEEGDGGHYHEGLELFLGFCIILGYDWEQIRGAYLEKNQINHRRQQNGY